MFDMLRNESGAVIKLFVNQVGMTIFGLLISFATVSNRTLLLFGSAFSVLFYMFLLYTAAWDIGARDKVKIDGGRAQKTPSKGVILAIFANAPTFIFTLLTLIAYLLASHFSLVWAAGTARVLNFINHMLNGMYIGFTSLIENEILRITSFFVLPVPAIAITGAAYYLGLKNVKLFSFSPKER